MFDNFGTEISTPGLAKAEVNRVKVCDGTAMLTLKQGMGFSGDLEEECIPVQAEGYTTGPVGEKGGRVKSLVESFGRLETLHL